MQAGRLLGLGFLEAMHAAKFYPKMPLLMAVVKGAEQPAKWGGLFLLSGVFFEPFSRDESRLYRAKSHPQIQQFFVPSPGKSIVATKARL